MRKEAEVEKTIRDLQAGDYDKHQEKTKTRWFGIMESRVVRNHLSLRDQSDQTKILDAGAGTGEISCSLLKVANAQPTFSLDFSIESLRALKGKNRSAKTIGGDLTAIPFKDGVFDRIACVKTIQHMPPDNIQDALREFYRVLSDGGVLVLTAYNERLFQFSGKPTKGNFDNGLYYCSFSEESLKRYCEAASFKEIRVYGLGFFYYFSTTHRHMSKLYRYCCWLTMPVEKFISTRLSKSSIINSNAAYFVVVCRKA